MATGISWKPTIWPVSYTHLDVYKRQVFMSCSSDDNNDNGKVENTIIINGKEYLDDESASVSYNSYSQSISFEAGFSNPESLMAVSYTHLDVYKRQRPARPEPIIAHSIGKRYFRLIPYIAGSVTPR